MLTLICIFPRTLVYSLSLVSFVSFLVVYTVYNSCIAGLLGLLIILVYVGAIIIMIRYICAVSPNIKYTLSFIHYISLLLFFFTFFICCLVPRVYLTSASSSFLTPSFFFTDVGLAILSILCLFIILLLIISTYIRPVASSLRSSVI